MFSKPYLIQLLHVIVKEITSLSSVLKYLSRKAIIWGSLGNESVEKEKVVVLLINAKDLKEGWCIPWTGHGRKSGSKREVRWLRWACGQLAELWQNREKNSWNWLQLQNCSCYGVPSLGSCPCAAFSDCSCVMEGN